MSTKKTREMVEESIVPINKFEFTAASSSSSPFISKTKPPKMRKFDLW